MPPPLELYIIGNTIHMGGRLGNLFIKFGRRGWLEELLFDGHHRIAGWHPQSPQKGNLQIGPIATLPESLAEGLGSPDAAEVRAIFDMALDPFLYEFRLLNRIFFSLDDHLGPGRYLRIMAVAEFGRQQERG